MYYISILTLCQYFLSLISVFSSCTLTAFHDAVLLTQLAIFTVFVLPMFINFHSKKLPPDDSMRIHEHYLEESIGRAFLTTQFYTLVLIFAFIYAEICSCEKLQQSKVYTSVTLSRPYPQSSVFVSRYSNPFFSTHRAEALFSGNTWAVTSSTSV